MGQSAPAIEQEKPFLGFVVYETIGMTEINPSVLVPSGFLLVREEVEIEAAEKKTVDLC